MKSKADLEPMIQSMDRLKNKVNDLGLLQEEVQKLKWDKAGSQATKKSLCDVWRTIWDLKWSQYRQPEHIQENSPIDEWWQNIPELRKSKESKDLYFSVNGECRGREYSLGGGLFPLQQE